MYREIRDFDTDWKSEAERTLAVLRQLTDASLAQRVTADGRSLGTIAWHVTRSLRTIPSAAGLRVDAPSPDAPADANAIGDAYQRAALDVGRAVREQWSTSQLGDSIVMYGRQWLKGEVLSELILHQAHHRGQMTVLMRQAGLLVPGIYGPAREEWAAVGRPAPE